MAKKEVKQVIRQAQDEKQEKMCADPEYRKNHKPPFSIKIKMALLKLKMYGQINKILSMPFVDLEDMTADEENKLKQMWIQYDLAMEYIRQQNLSTQATLKNMANEQKLRAHAKGKNKKESKALSSKKKMKTTGKTAASVLARQKASVSEMEEDTNEVVMEKETPTRSR